MPEIKDWLTKEEVAEWLGCRPGQVDTRGMGGEKRGGRVMVPWSGVEEYIQNGVYNQAGYNGPGHDEIDRLRTLRHVKVEGVPVGIEATEALRLMKALCEWSSNPDAGTNEEADNLLFAAVLTLAAGRPDEETWRSVVEHFHSAKNSWG